MRKGLIITAVLASLALVAFGYARYQDTQPVIVTCGGTDQPNYVCTIAPLSAILRELCAGHANVETLLQAGASPHTYEPKPSDLQKVVNARGFFYVDDRLDGWATKLPSEHRIKVLDMVPESCRLRMQDDCCPEGHEKPSHHHELIIDPHFWLDPCVVRDSLPGLLAALCELDPAGKQIYEKNAKNFTASLTGMDAEVHALIDPLKGSKVATTHPSFQYLCHEYGLEVAMVVSDSPGKEPSPRRIEELANLAREQGVKAIYSEPQIPRGAASMLSEASGIPLFELDPVGGCSGRCEYSELILYNAHMLADSLQ